MQVPSPGPHRSFPLPPLAILSKANRPLKFLFRSERQMLGIHLWHCCVLLSGSVCGEIWRWCCFLWKYDKVENHIVKNSIDNILLWIRKLSFKSGWWSNYSLQFKCKQFFKSSQLGEGDLQPVSNSIQLRGIFALEYTEN